MALIQVKAKVLKTYQPRTAPIIQSDGWRKEDRMVGGDPADPNSIPWQVALVEGERSKSVQCGGTIIAPKFVLTAAHCIEWQSDYVDRRLQVRAGEHDLLNHFDN